MLNDAGTILVVDDEPEMRALLHDVLQERGHHVTDAQSGREALKRLVEAECAVLASEFA